jgi:hypothetical protein
VEKSQGFPQAGKPVPLTSGFSLRQHGSKTWGTKPLSSGKIYLASLNMD